MLQYYQDIIEKLIKAGVDVEKDFFYLGGGMTGYRHYNYEKFDEVFTVLDANYNIASPARLDTSEDLETILNSETGMNDDINSRRSEFLARDLTICAMPQCVGGIFLEGYQDSPGAKAESALLTALEKDVYEFSYGTLGLPTLTLVPKVHRTFTNRKAENAGAIA
jgi:hypothetical protein